VELFDLTQTVYETMPVYPGDPPVSVAKARSHEVDGYEVGRFCMGCHTGTHLDAPRHFFPDGATLDQYPVERFVGPAVLVDCDTNVVADVIEGDVLAERLAPAGLPAGAKVLIRTGGRPLTAEAAQLLVTARAGLVGVDTASPDAEPYPVHRLLLGNDILILENLEGLDRLEPGPLMCACLPLALTGTDAAPARVIVWR